MYITGAGENDMKQMVKDMAKMFPNVTITYERRNERGRTWNVWAKSNSYNAPGWRYSATGRRLPHACWHVWGRMIEALPDHVCYRSSLTSGLEKCGNDAIWYDVNVGSRFEPVLMSETCGMCRGYGSGVVPIASPANRSDAQNLATLHPPTNKWKVIQ